MPSTSFDLSNVIIRAGAGAGKTTDLVRRVLEMEDKFLSTEKRHARIVVTTFTRKATQELKERLLAKALASENKKFVEFVQRSSLLHISTIHGVLSLYLSRYGSALGLSPQFQILSQKAVLKRAKKIFRENLQKSQAFAESASRLLEIIDLSQLLEAMMLFENMWSLGKNQVLTKDKHLQLMQQSCGTLQEHAEYLFDLLSAEELNESWETYRAALERLLLKKDLASTDYLSFLSSTKSPVKTKKTSQELADCKNDFQDALKKLLGFAWSPEFVDLHERLSQDFALLGTAWSERLLEEKLKTGELSLADLELIAMKLLKDFPETAKLFSEEWDYWMVDEYQDTSPLQVELLKALMGERPSFTVGDPQQSIYLFRGARSEVFLQKEQEIKALKGNALEMMKNYRTQGPLLQFFNDLFAHLNPQKFQAMEIGFHKDLKPVESEPVHVLLADSPEQEIAAAMVRVLELLKLGVSPEKICILSRGNKDLELLAAEAKALHIPVQVHSSSQFSDRQEIRDAVALLRFIANPSDNLSFLICLRSPFFFVKDEKLQLLGAFGAESYYSRALKLAWPQVQQLQELLEQSRKQGLVYTWLEALRQYKYFDFLKSLDSSGRKEANLWKLVNLLMMAEKTPGFSVLDFLDEMTVTNLEADGDQDATPVIEPSKVNLMTVHASKGLQFQYVILPFLGKRPPSPKAKFWLSSDDGDWTLSLPDPEDGSLTRSLLGDQILEQKKQRELEELERVFYVALTRAELGLSLLWSNEDKSSLAARVSSWLVGPMSEAKEAAIFDQVQTRENFSLRLRKHDWKNDIPELTNDFKPIQVRSQFQFVEAKKTQSVAVTEVLSESEGPQGQKESEAEESLQALQKAMLGVEVHRLFEAIKYQDNIDEVEEVKDPRVQSALRFLRNAQQGKLTQLIKSGQAEWGFAIQKNKWLMQGQIDLWSQDTDGSFVVADYKTGSEKHLEKAFEQLEIYAWALRRMRVIPQNVLPRLMVIYPFSENVFERPAKGFEQIDALLDVKSSKQD